MGGASDLPKSAIHVDLDTSDVRGIVGCKKRYGDGHFLRLSDTLHWNFRNDMLAEFLDLW